MKTGNTWSIVLAGGDGTRLRELTTGAGRAAVPKQFCSVRGGPSLIRRAIQRGETIAGPERTVVVVAEDHRRWWSAEVGDLPDANVIVQPCNRGTACGLLLPLVDILVRDPDATLLVLPSDHVVADEHTLANAMEAAVLNARLEPDRLLILGIEPERPDTGLGWIEPNGDLPKPIMDVSQFVEKPSHDQADELMRNGALWNSAIFAMHGGALLELFRRALPWLTEMFDVALIGDDATARPETIPTLYERLPSIDFSRAVLQKAGAEKRVVAVPPCGWTDVGTPEGVARCTAACVRPVDGEDCRHRHSATLDLAEALRSHLAGGGDPSAGDLPTAAEP
jgi:mannose-1-phosphate guanylyltransferase